MTGQTVDQVNHKVEKLVIALARKLLDSDNGITGDQYEALRDLMDETCESMNAQNLLDQVDATDDCFYIKSE